MYLFTIEREYFLKYLTSWSYRNNIKSKMRQKDTYVSISPPWLLGFHILNKGTLTRTSCAQCVYVAHVALNRVKTRLEASIMFNTTNSVCCVMVACVFICIKLFIIFRCWSIGYCNACHSSGNVYCACNFLVILWNYT